MIFKTSIKNLNANTSFESLQKSQAVISNRRIPFDFNGDNTSRIALGIPNDEQLVNIASEIICF